MDYTPGIPEWLSSSSQKVQDQNPDVEEQASPDLRVSTSMTAFNEKLQRFKYESANTLASRRSPRLSKLDSNMSATTRNSPHTSSTSPLKRLQNPGPCPTTSTSHRSPAKSSPPKPYRPSSKYAAPSRYAHLKPLTDVLAPNLLLIFVGVNPGISTAVAGHAYAHPSNRFWHLLHVCGLTPERKLVPSEDRDLPRLYSYGNTNIVERPTKDQGELSKEEMAAGTPVLEEKFRKCKPEAVCIVGKGIWEAIWRWRYGRPIRRDEFHYGWQDEKENMGRGDEGEVDGEGSPWDGARVFVATSTSGQAAFLRPAEKEAIWRPLGEWTQKRREERTQGLPPHSPSSKQVQTT